MLEKVKTIFSPLQPGLSPSQITPTIGQNIRRITLSSIYLKFWDLGGLKDIRRIWEKYRWAPGELSSSSHLATIWPYESSDLSSLSYTALDSSRSLSVDDLYLNINSDALLDLLRRDGKRISRGRSMSDRYDIITELFGRSIDSIHNSPRTAMYSLPLVTHQFPQSTQWNTTSIAQMIRQSTTPELDKLVKP
ncbi:hypothetical protein PCANC_28909 [Puccinia coronata f. sp. avenae]|uniref:Uncharacterized protein n=1 Tax=Puccinia coronata f. sp. avenae TaxID=200324 RepID=A0A2N5RWE2_9BASI|nr:hypothetical protein PCANC_28909 [Puccinia coronata f. sp. avenae]